MNDENTEQEDELDDEEVRDTWKTHEQTILFARMTRGSARNALEALVNVSNTSSDPEVRAMASSYQALKAIAQKLDGVEGRKAKLP